MSMLQAKQISRVLSQGLTPIEVKSTDASASAMQPISISLLSHNGVPLSTVSCSNFQDTNLSLDNVKIYSLLGVNYFKSQFHTIKDNWCVLEIDSNLSVILKRLDLEHKEELSEHDLYVIILYDHTMPHSLAKIKVDSLAVALNEGLVGYKPS